MKHLRFPRKYLKYHRVWCSGFSKIGVLGDPKTYLLMNNEFSYYFFFFLSRYYIFYKNDFFSAFSAQFLHKKIKIQHKSTIFSFGYGLDDAAFFSEFFFHWKKIEENQQDAFKHPIIFCSGNRSPPYPSVKRFTHIWGKFVW